MKTLESRITEHMEVVGSDGFHVGVVDSVDGRRIKLTKNDPRSPGEHRYINLDDVESVEDGAVWLSATAREAKALSREDLSDEPTR